MSEDLGNKIYSGAAEYGKFKASIGAVLGTIIGIGMIIFAIIAFTHKTKFTAKTTGISIDHENKPRPVPNCIWKYNGRGNTRVDYSCHFKLKYKVEDTEYVKIFDTNNSTNYSGENEIIVYYDPKNPFNSSIYKDNYKLIGYILLGFGLFLILVSWIGLWVTRKYKFAAAASGISSILR